MDAVVISWILNPDQVNLHRVNPVWSGWEAMQGDFKSPVTVYQTYCKRCAEDITDFLKATDSMKIFSIMYILYSSYCLLHLQNSERHFQNCALRYNFLHAALRCSSFCVKTVIYLRLYVCSWYVQFCMLLKDSVFVLWINKLKCSLKTSVSQVLATEHLKL